MNEPRKVNWLTAFLLSLFFGFFGIDRFYMGHPVLGILKLITGGFAGIWWLIDLILIAVRYQFNNVEWVD